MPFFKVLILFLSSTRMVFQKHYFSSFTMLNHFSSQYNALFRSGLYEALFSEMRNVLHLVGWTSVF